MLVGDVDEGVVEVPVNSQVQYTSHNVLHSSSSSEPPHPDPADIHASVALSLLIKLEVDPDIKV